MPLAFRGMRSRAVTGFVSKLTYIRPDGSPAPAARCGDRVCCRSPRAAAARRPAHRTGPGPALLTCVDCVRGSRRPVPEHHRKYML